MKIQGGEILGAMIERQFDHNGELNILAGAGTWMPVAITIREDRIDVSVWGEAINGTGESGWGWALRGESSNPNDPDAYEFVGVKDYRREGWIRHHQMRDCPTISVRQDYEVKDGKMFPSGWYMNRWSEGYGLNNGSIGPYSGEEVRGDMYQRIRAYTWLMKRVDELLDPQSPIRRHAEAMRVQNDAEHDRRDYESRVRNNNRTLVMSDCYHEIQRADKRLWDVRILKMATKPVDMPTFNVTHKQHVAIDAAIYGLAMGEDYTKAGEGWIDKVREGRRFSPKDVEEYYPDAMEFNSLQLGGILVNMWNALATHSQRAEIADYAEMVWRKILRGQAPDSEIMKATHDESEAKWFMFHIESEAKLMDKTITQTKEATDKAEVAA